MYLYNDISRFVRNRIPIVDDEQEVYFTIDELIEFISDFCAEFDGVEQTY